MFEFGCVLAGHLQIWCSTYETNHGDYLLPLTRDLASACSDDTNHQAVEIGVCFPLKHIVTEHIESFQYGGLPPMIDVSNRPLLDAIRKELAKMVAMLDSIEYVEE